MEYKGVGYHLFLTMYYISLVSKSGRPTCEQHWSLSDIKQCSVTGTTLTLSTNGKIFLSFPIFVLFEYD